MRSYASLLPPEVTICKSKCICNYLLLCHYLPLLLFIHHITEFSEKPFVRCVPLNFSTVRRWHREGAAVPLLPTWPMPPFGGAGGGTALLLFSGRSELLGWQGWGGAGMKNRVEITSSATAEQGVPGSAE